MRCASWREDGRLQMAGGKPEVLPDFPPELPTCQNFLREGAAWLPKARDEIPVEPLVEITSQARADLVRRA